MTVSDCLKITCMYKERAVVNAILYIGLGWVFASLASGILLDHSLLCKLAMPLIVVVSFVWPVKAICIFLVASPWIGGSQPGDLHTQRFLLMFCGLCLGTVAYAFFSLFRGKPTDVPWQNPLVFAMLVYWFVTALSLTSVHPNGILWALVSFNPSLSREFLLYDEGFEIYPWVSFVTLTLAFWLFFFLMGMFKEKPPLKILMLKCLGLGAVITIFFGMLDHFDFIDLHYVRPLIATPWRFDRFTSIFGNPTWYAQYITLCAPTILTALLLKWKRSRTIALLVAMMVVTEFCIVLTKQRGAWLAYPLTLVVVWFCFYVIWAEGSDGVVQNVWSSFKRAWVKILITLPLTLVLSLLVVYLTTYTNLAARQSVRVYVERAQSVTNVHERLAYTEPTIKLFGLHPLLGGGVDAFRHQYEKAFMMEGHPCELHDTSTISARGSAHNLYFQTLVGKGIAGLLSLLGVMLSAIYLCWRSIFSPSFRGPTLALSIDNRVVIVTGFAFTLALAMYGNVGEIFYSPINYVVFVVFYAAMACAADGVAQISIRCRWGLVIALVVLLVLHLYLERIGTLTC